MFVFGTRSIREYNTLDTDLQQVADLVMSWQIIDFGILKGHRGEDEQNEAFNKKRSTKEWPNSKHNKYPSRALDFVNVPLVWNKEVDYVYIGALFLAAGKILGTPVKWGGDWNRNGTILEKLNWEIDLGHIEKV